MALVMQQALTPAAVEQRDAEGVLQPKGSIASSPEAVTGVGPCQLSGRICDCSECLWGQLACLSKKTMSALRLPARSYPQHPLRQNTAKLKGGWCLSWQRTRVLKPAANAAVADSCAHACVVSLQAATMRQWSASMQNTCILCCPVLLSCPSFGTSRSAQSLSSRNSAACWLAACHAEVLSG